MSGPRILVTLCTYNERENIELLIPRILELVPAAHVLVVDDGSPDGTGELADEMGRADERVKVLHRSEKAGLGAATLAGFQWGIDRGYDLLVNLDADHSHPPETIPRLLERADEAEVVVASRYVPGGGIEGWNWWRHFMSRGINLYSRWLLWLRTRDCSGSFRCYSVAKLAEIDPARFRSVGYSFQEEILYRCRRVGCRFVEVPFVFKERLHGVSKINWREAVEALWVIFRLSFDSLFRVRVAKREEAPTPTVTSASTGE